MAQLMNCIKSRKEYDTDFVIKQFLIHKRMIEFTLDEDSMPFNFFEEVDFSFDSIAIKCLNKKYPHLSESECEKIFDSHYDLFSEKMFELKDSEAILDYCIGEEEIDESSGTYGYFHFAIDDIDKVKIQLEREAQLLIEEIIESIESP
jgi:hypothetical protein